MINDGAPNSEELEHVKAVCEAVRNAYKQGSNDGYGSGESYYDDTELPNIHQSLNALAALIRKQGQESTHVTILEVARSIKSGGNNAWNNVKTLYKLTQPLNTLAQRKSNPFLGLELGGP